MSAGDDALIAEVLTQIGGSVGVRSSLEHLSDHLRGEPVVVAATGFLDGHSGLVVITDRRLIFADGPKARIDVALASIVSFRARRGLLACDLHVDLGDQRAVIKQVHPKAQLRKLGRRLAGSA
ncbi:MAG TPA: PH domain-containing protein [Acidimicrobiales bacterium]|nr:PH domain-containing protein [Acidimicrobiales bacterium]